MHRTLRIASVVLLGTMLVQCKLLKKRRSDDSSPASRLLGAKSDEDVAVERWQWEGSKLKGVGTKLEAMFFVGSDSGDPAVVAGSFQEFPAGTKVTLGKESTTISASKYGRVTANVREQLGSLSADSDWTKEFDLNLSLTIELPGKPAVTEKVAPLRVEGGLGKVLGKVVDKPVAFPNEKPAPAQAKSLAWISAPSMTSLKILGNAEHVSDLDWIAIETNEPSTRTKACEFKKGKATVQMVDEHVKVYDRRDGHAVSEKVILAHDKCPTIAFITDGKASQYADKADTEKYLRGLLAKPPSTGHAAPSKAEKKPKK